MSQTRGAMIGLIALLSGLLIGFGLRDVMGAGILGGNTASAQQTTHLHGDGSLHLHNASSGSHVHAQFDISGQDLIPTVSIEVSPDPMSGWNVGIETTNFRFSPENASLGHVENEGHAHIYVDGEKIGRVYGDWYHLPALGAGQHTIMVTLNGNDHTDWVVDGELIKAMVTVTE